ncbi:hypothetical protein WDW86_07665 [Bdellovibrionota bacterium FG-2]
MNYFRMIIIAAFFCLEQASSSLAADQCVGKEFDEYILKTSGIAFSTLCEAVLNHAQDKQQMSQTIGKARSLGFAGAKAALLREISTVSTRCKNEVVTKDREDCEKELEIFLGDFKRLEKLDSTWGSKLSLNDRLYLSTVTLYYSLLKPALSERHSNYLLRCQLKYTEQCAGILNDLALNGQQVLQLVRVSRINADMTQ